VSAPEEAPAAEAGSEAPAPEDDTPHFNPKSRPSQSQ